MNRKNYKRHLAYEALVVLGLSSILLYICRLWPLLTLTLLAMPPVGAWLIVSNRHVEPPDEPKSLPLLSGCEQNEAFGRIQAEVSKCVRSEYPNARWIWKTPNAKALVSSGADAVILLNRAGGYREAIVHMDGGSVAGIEYLQTGEEKENEAGEEPSGHSEQINYELLAFEWVDTNFTELNERCNEGIALGLDALILRPGELPEPESWQEICCELKRNGVGECECSDEGIRISLAAERSRP